MYRALGALILTLIFASTAEARPRHRTYLAHPDCNVLWPCEGVSASTRGEKVVKAMGGFGSAQKVYKPRVAKVDYRHLVRERKRPLPMVTVVARAVSGIVAPLAAKVAEIQGACGSKVVSAVRHTRVAGTRVMSLHASGQAVDMAGNPSCIARLLVGWVGGASNDYARMGHYHISYGGREHGVRFAHGGNRHSRRLRYVHAR